jgi:NitT/TauT family transport system substrate-binding protein
MLLRHQRFTRLVPVVAVIVCIVGVTASSGGAAGARAGVGSRTQPVTVVVLQGSISDVLVPLGVAQGIFRDNGLAVNVLTAQSGTAQLSAVASGAAQFGEVGSANAFPAMANGASIKFVTDLQRVVISFIAQTDVNLPNAKQPYPAMIHDLKGLRIGVSGLNGSTHFLVLKALSDAGMSPSDVTVIPVGGASTGVAAFKARQIDVLVAFEPEQTLIGPSRYKTILNAVEVQKRLYPAMYGHAVYAANATTVAQKPGVVKSFCTAVNETLRYALNKRNKPDVAAFISAWSGLTKTQSARMWTSVADSFDLIFKSKAWSTTAQPPWPGPIPPYSSTFWAPCQKIVQKNPAAPDR